MLVFFCVPVVQGTAMPQQENPLVLKNTAQKLKIGIDPEFSAFLMEKKHSGSMLAPDFFRTLALGVPFDRMEIQTGIEFSVHGLIFFWYVNEFAAPGRPEEVAEKIKTIMDDEGFIADPAEPDSGVLSFSRERAGIFCLVEVQGLQRYVGGSRTRSGGSLRVMINTSLTGLSYTHDMVVRELPYLVPEGFPVQVLDYMKHYPVEEVSCGGTWEHYYTWTIKYRFDTKEKAAGVVAGLEQNLPAIGYNLSREDRGTRTYFLHKTEAPVLYIHPEDEYSFSIRVQPRM